MDTFNIVIAFAVILAVIEALAQNSLKISKRGKSDVLFYVGIMFYIGIGYVLHEAYHKIGLGKMNLIWSSISIISALTLGYLIHDERITGYTLLSMTLAVSAIYVAYVGDEAGD